MDTPRQLGAVTASLLLLAGLQGQLTAQAYAANNIRGIELNSTPSATQIVLRADGRIPHRIVSRSSEKIVIDLGSIDPTKSIQTDFAAADNIEQVILKPLASDRVRMVIRGEDLAPPVVTLAGRRIAHVNNRPVFQEESGPSGTAVLPTPGHSLRPQSTAHISAPTESGFAMTATETPKALLPTPGADLATSQTAPTAPQAGVSEENTGLPADPSTSTDELSLNNETALDETGDSDFSDSDSFAPKPMDRPALVGPTEADNSISMEEQEASPLDSMMDTVMGLLSQFKKQVGPDKGILFQICGLSGVLILLGLLIRSKMTNPESYYPDEPTFQPTIRPSLLERWFGRKPKRARKTARQGRGGGVFHEESPSAPTRNASYRPGERPVGLNSLNQQMTPRPADMAPNAMLQKNQALSQYARNAMPPSQTPPSRNASEVDRELKRSLQMRETITKSQTRKPYQTPGTVTPRSAGAPQASRTAPPAQNRPQGRPTPQAQPAPGLPANNNEVLEFLRSVAELMEKDGSPERAQGVKNGMLGRTPR